MSRKSAERKHVLTADQSQKELVKLIESFSHGHHPHTVFSDFVELSAIAISNSVDHSQYETREKRYLEIVGKYKREEVARFPQMLALLTGSFELRVQAIRKAKEGGHAMASGGLTDVLGETYMMLELGNARAGQFFTPYHVSRMMAMMTIGDGGEAVKRHGFMRLQEPACGAGGMVIAAAESLHDAGLNYQQAMHATCIDIDLCCVKMAYVQLSLLHIPAVVVHGNALTLDVWGMWYTPAHIMGGWRWKLRRSERDLLEQAATLEAASSDDTVQVDEPIVAGASVDDDDVAVIEYAPPVSAVVNEEAACRTSSLVDLFEESVATTTTTVFERIDQLALF